MEWFKAMAARERASSIVLPTPMPSHTRYWGDLCPNWSSLECSLSFKNTFCSMLRVVTMKN